MRIDLHTHTTASDGTDTPGRAGGAAAGAGLDVVAVTDHDTTAGWDEALAARPRRADDRAGRRVLLRVQRRRRAPDQPAPARLPVRSRRRGPAGRAGTAARQPARAAAGRSSRTWSPTATRSPGSRSATSPTAARSAARTSAARWSRPASCPTCRRAFRDLLSSRPQYHVRKVDTDVFDAIALVRAAGGLPVFAHPLARRRGPVVDDDVIAAMAAAGMVGPRGRSPRPRRRRPGPRRRAGPRARPDRHRLVGLPRHEQADAARRLHHRPAAYEQLLALPAALAPVRADGARPAAQRDPVGADHGDGRDDDGRAGEQLMLADMPQRLFACTPSRLAAFDCPRRYRFTYLDRPTPPRGAPWAHNTVGAVGPPGAAPLVAAAARPAARRTRARAWWSATGSRRLPRRAQSNRALREHAAGWVRDYLDRASTRPTSRSASSAPSRCAPSAWPCPAGSTASTSAATSSSSSTTRPAGTPLTDDDARGSQALALYVLAVRRTLRRACRRVELHHLPTGTVAAFEHTDGVARPARRAGRGHRGRHRRGHRHAGLGRRRRRGVPAAPSPGCSLVRLPPALPRGPGRRAASSPVGRACRTPTEHLPRWRHHRLAARKGALLGWTDEHDDGSGTRWRCTRWSTPPPTRPRPSTRRRPTPRSRTSWPAPTPASTSWRRTSIEERAAILSRVAELYTERRDELAAIITREMGKRTEEAKGEI